MRKGCLNDIRNKIVAVIIAILVLLLWRECKWIKCRSSHSEVFLGKIVLKISSKFTGEHPCQSVISKKLLCNFIEITLRRGCSPVNLLHIFTKPFSSNTSGWLLLTIWLMVLKILLLIVYCEIIANPLTFSISSFSTVLKFSSIFVSHTGQNLSPNWYLMSILKY